MTAKELAKEFGISPATMSLIINNKPGVGEKLRAEVLKQINERGYSYLLKGDALVPAPKKNICFAVYQDGGDLLGNRHNSFLPYIMDGIEYHAQKYGYNLTYLTISKENLIADLQRIKQTECAGFIVFATELRASQVQAFWDVGIHFVLLDAYFNNQKISAVTVNNEQGIYLAAEHLVQNGHREIGYLTSGLDLVSFRDRRHFADKALQDFGIANMKDYTYQIGYPDTEAYEGMKTLLAQGIKLPTAFMADNDLVAAGAMKALKEAGYRIPEDISIVGFDDRSICTMTEPPMTTVQIPRRYFGGEAVELLQRILEDKIDCALRMALNNSLVERGSVAKLN